MSFLAVPALCMIADMVEGSAFVLAGGRSSRMGTDKAFVQFHGRTLLERALKLVTAVTRNVYILGSRARFGGFGDVIEDEIPDHGPLGGIHAALRATASDGNLMLAVDMPFVTEAFLRYLLHEAEQSGTVVTVPRVAETWQPLCAVYRRVFADLAEPALLSGRNKIDSLFRETSVRIIEEQELQRAGFDSALFGNVNTPEELRAAEHAGQNRQ